MLNKPEDVKSMVKILLLQDTLPDRTTGLPGGAGSAIARELLTKIPPDRQSGHGPHYSE